MNYFGGIRLFHVPNHHLQILGTRYFSVGTEIFEICLGGELSLHATIITPQLNGILI